MRQSIIVLLAMILLTLVLPAPNTSIIIPVKAHIVTDDSGYYTSSRDSQDIQQLFREVNRIWAQANIVFSVQVINTSLIVDAVPNALNGNYDLIVEQVDPHYLNIFFVQSLNGINGQAMVGRNAALVSDFTTINDFRTTAHEIGHLFGLRHVDNSTYLMAQGKNGEILSKEEINEVLLTMEKINT